MIEYATIASFSLELRQYTARAAYQFLFRLLTYYIEVALKILKIAACINLYGLICRSLKIGLYDISKSKEYREILKIIIIMR